LWAAWQRSGLQRRWLIASERGGPIGAQAARDLDAVTALFDITDQYVTRTAGASLGGLIEHVTALQLPAVNPEPVSPAEQVSVLSAHAALGHEWDLVVIAGLQEGLWPNTIPRGGVLRTQLLLDVLDGVSQDASMRAPLLADERRLLVAAMGRARRRLLVTAVDSDAEDAGREVALPSAFFFEIAQWASGEGDPGTAQPVAAPRVLSAAAVVGRLRGTVCAPDGTVNDGDRACAATQLARLARAGVPGADPAGWHGLIPASTAEPLWSGDDHVVTLTPSTLQTLNDCPLRWLAERHGGTDARDLRSTIGSVLHALIAEPAKTESELLAELDRAWEHLPFDAPWYSANELARHRAMIQVFVGWRAQTRRELTEVGVEVDVDGTVETPAGAKVRLCGRVDRVERDGAGRLVVVDVKTGKTPVTKDEAQRHAQLAAYQLAVAEGLTPASGWGYRPLAGECPQPFGDEPGGARLVYLGRTGADGVTEREQDPLTPAARDTWRNLIGQAAAATAGPRFLARVNDGCGHCPLRPSCPAHTGADGSGLP
jgi:RecB family exonuclease